MRKLSEHLTWEEIRCKCGECDGGDITQATTLLFEKIRSVCTMCAGHDVPITVNSGYRCPAHNCKVAHTGEHGPHTKGIALDLACPAGMTLDEFHGVCLACNPEGGVGFYRGKKFIHVDTRGVKARWEE